MIVAPVEVAEDVPSEEGKVVKKRKKSKVAEEEGGSADAGLGSILGAIKASVGGGEAKKERKEKRKKEKKEKAVESSA